VKTKSLTDAYLLGLEAEVLNERITTAAAHHITQMYAVGEDTELGQMHFESVPALVKLRSTISLTEPNTLKAIALSLDAMRAGRAHLQSLRLALEHADTIVVKPQVPDGTQGGECQLLLMKKPMWLAFSRQNQTPDAEQVFRSPHISSDQQSSPASLLLLPVACPHQASSSLLT